MPQFKPPRAESSRARAQRKRTRAGYTKTTITNQITAQQAARRIAEHLYPELDITQARLMGKVLKSPTTTNVRMPKGADVHIELIPDSKIPLSVVYGKTIIPNGVNTYMDPPVWRHQGFTITLNDGHEILLRRRRTVPSRYL